MAFSICFAACTPGARVSCFYHVLVLLPVISYLEWRETGYFLGLEHQKCFHLPQWQLLLHFAHFILENDGHALLSDCGGNPEPTNNESLDFTQVWPGGARLPWTWPISLSHSCLLPRLLPSAWINWRLNSNVLEVIWTQMSFFSLTPSP